MVIVMLKIGLKGQKSIKVTEEKSAKAMGSGELSVFATPAMIALMEETASESVKPFIDAESSTVGTLINVKHLSATPLGDTVRCETELTEIDRRRLVFSVKAFDGAGLIGEGTHERFIINIEKFMEKTAEKLS